VAHFFPDLSDWLKDVRDQRDPDLTTYPARFLLWMGLMLFLMRLGSRRRLDSELDSPEALINLNSLAGDEQKKVADHDTLNYFLVRVPLNALPRLRRKMIRRLVRMKALDHGRLMGHFPVVLDGTGQLHFQQRHCRHCLEQKRDGHTLYYHNVLEAKLVTPEGLAISLDSEFIENADPKASKQDCELKAFARIAQRLKTDFPQLQFCLLLDGLFANGTAMSICQKNRWKYITTFKEGSLPALWTDYQALLRQCPENRKAHRTPQGVRQTFAWVEQLEHVDNQKRTHRVNAFQCQERDDRGEKTGFFAWLTNWHITPDTVVALGNRGGRCRWKIENEGFNVQKNNGFNLEHAYSLDDVAIKNFYVLMQIAHLITQLVERGRLFDADARKLFGSLSDLARRLAESIRNVVIAADAIDPANARSIQIRLNTS
jgi:hypothetical protein